MKAAGLFAALLVVWIPAVAPPVAEPRHAAPAPPAAADQCRFCGAINDPGHYFCARCARLFRADTADPAGRFWGDAFCVVHYPPLNEKPHISSECSGGRMRSEKATFDAGDLYEATMSKKGVLEVSGQIRAWTSAGTVDYHAQVTDTLNDAGRLARREVRAEVQDNPTRHLYRRIEYQYAGEKLRGFTVSNWMYRDAGDWKSKPAEWVRHDTARVEISYAAGVPSRIVTSSREVTHGLRGQVEYGETRAMAHAVVVAQGGVARVEDSTP